MDDAVREQRNARHRLKALLLRNGTPYAGKCSWTAAHLRWLATVKMEHSAQQISLREYLHSITEAGARIARLEQAMRDALPGWSLRPLVQALQALRGVQLIAAMTLVAELQDFLRFDNPRKLMAYVGLVPGEHSSGPKRRQGSITKAGNSAARRMLVEMAWHYQHGARVSAAIVTRQSDLPKAVTDIAWAAQLRLHSKFKRLVARRVMKTKAVVAVARELTGFVWAIGREVRPPAGREFLSSRRRTPRPDRTQHQHSNFPKEVINPAIQVRCRRGNAALPRPLGNPRKRYWWASQHEQPSHIHHGWQPLAPSRSPSGNGYPSDLLRRGTRAPEIACA